MSGLQQQPGPEASARDHHYQVFGLILRSQIPLPELHEASGGPADVTIMRGPVPQRNDRNGLSLFGDAALLTIPKVGRYWIDSGREILVEPDPGASERNVRLYLLGSALGGILHQRRLLPLHANAVEVEGHAVAFMGHPGAGKSTMAAWFFDRGHRVLADDVCVVTFGADGRPLAHPGIPRLRLWREAIEATGRVAEDYELSFDDMDKFNVPTLQAGTVEPLPLHHVYLLGKAGPEETSPAIRALKGIASVDALVANTYRGAYLPLMDATAQHLRQCLRLVSTAPVFTADRRWGFDSFEAQAMAIEAHARALIRGRGAPASGRRSR